MKCKKIGHWAICCKNNCRETNEIIKENIKFLGEIKESINQKEEDWTRRVGLQIGTQATKSSINWYKISSKNNFRLYIIRYPGIFITLGYISIGSMLFS